MINGLITCLKECPNSFFVQGRFDGKEGELCLIRSLAACYSLALKFTMLLSLPFLTNRDVNSLPRPC